MASHIEMQRLAADPAAVQGLARHLLALPDARWTDWELDFLDHMATRREAEPLTIRQSEVLVELRDNAKSYTSVGGIAVRSLLHGCWIGRADLDEDDEAFVVALHDAGAVSLKRRALLRLMRCARQLGLVEGYLEVD
jgi:hypothetical protein